MERIGMYSANDMPSPVSPQLHVGDIYSRADLHAVYGGQLYTRISTPAEHDLILLFADDPVGETEIGRAHV